MPEFGTLAVDRPAAGVAGGNCPAPWRLEAVTLVQVTFEVPKAAALALLPPSASRPIPPYARLIALNAADSPAGPLRLAALCVAGRHLLAPRNVVAEMIVDGPLEELRGAFGGPAEAGSVVVEQSGAKAIVSVESGGERLAEAELPELHAVDPAMLRWDGWLSFGPDGLLTFPVEAGTTAAYLTKKAGVRMGSGLSRSHLWRRLAPTQLISACAVSGSVTLGETTDVPD